MAYDVEVAIGDWDDKMDLMVVPLDDFDVILDDNFFIVAKVAIMLHFGLLPMNHEKKPCFVVGHGMPIVTEL